MRQSSQTLAAIMMVRNEQHIVASSIGHLLTTLGVDRIYVTDNGSTDRTPDILRRIAGSTSRVVVDFHPGDFRQADIFTALARRARLEGMDWVLPTDADEFFWLRPGVSLASLCSRDGIGGYRLSVCNFLQARPVRRDWFGSLLTMGVAAVPFGSVADGRGMVGSGEIPFVRITCPSKLLLRTAASLEIAFGNHDASHTAGPLAALEDGVILHAPIRSPGHLRRRAEVGRRTEAVTPDPGQSWHVKRIAAMDTAALDEEWRRNSYAPLRPVLPGKTRLDLRLCRVGLQQSGFSRRFGRI